MSEWKEYKLGEIAELRREKFTPNGTTTYPYIGLEHIEPKSLRINGIGSSNDVSSQKSVFYPNDILYGKLRPYFQKVYTPDFKGVCSTDIFVVKPKKGIAAKFLFYLLASDEFTNISNQGSTGTRMPRADWNHLKTTEWMIPSLPTQTAIAEILSSLDDKIELNNKINKELEDLAQTLFKRWFIDFEFPNENGEPYKSSGGEMVESELGEIPKGWEIGTLNDILDVKGGTTPSTNEPKFWNGSINWTSPRDLSNLKFPLLIDTEKKITNLGLSKISSGLLPKGTLLLSSRAPIGYLAITNIETAINQGYIAINGKIGFSNLYILNWLKSNMSLVMERANGSTFLEISKTNFKQINCSIPPFSVLDEFNTQVELLFDQLKVNIKENQQLTNLRDTLLPKLISGELEVKNINF
jgi:type I restriction enzyme S subunit